MKKATKGNFKRLVDYLTNPLTKHERVGHVNITNCHQTDPIDATLEVQAIQLQNKRSGTNKTYHLMLSFRAGELPEEDVLKAVETEICNGLGFANHQRISVVHHDTDNLHVHIAINKIHPEKLTCHTPYNDHKVLGALCEKLEVKYGLEKDNHIARQKGSENRAFKMEHSAGVESLLGWVQKNCKEKMEMVTSWEEMHQIINKHGLSIQKRGNGLVIADENKIMIKASSVARNLSMQKLESRLGPFEQPCLKPQNIEKKYSQSPINFKINTDALYQAYRLELSSQSSSRNLHLELNYKNRLKSIEVVKQASRLKIAFIKNMVKGPEIKKQLYMLNSKKVKEKLAEIIKSYTTQKKTIYTNFKKKSWNEWLQSQVLEGNNAALQALRSKRSRESLKGDIISAEKLANKLPVIDDSLDFVTKKGVLVYSISGSSIRDDGESLQVSKYPSENCVNKALTLAIIRYGNKININGSDEFKELVLGVAAKYKLNLSFENPYLESRRQSLVNHFNNQDINYDKSNIRESNRRVDGCPRLDKRSLKGATNSKDGGRHNKSKLGKIGASPPPQGKNCLRNLSQLGVVQFSDRSEVLLPSNVSSNVEHQRAEPNNAVRRGPNRTREVISIVESKAMDLYIAERDSKRKIGIAILRHKRFEAGNNCIGTFQGIRKVQGCTLALLQQDNEIVVIPIHKAVVHNLRKIRIGKKINLKLFGLSQARAISR